MCREEVYATTSCREVVEELRELASRDPSPCSIAGTMVAEPFDTALEAYKLFSKINYNDPESFTSVTELRRRLEKLVSSLLGVEVRILYTYGGSESTLTALYGLREAYHVKAVIASKAAHASVFKACRILGLHCHQAQVDSCLRVDVDHLEKILRSIPYRAAIVVTLGLTDNGALDPIEEVTSIACSYDTPVYIDAVFGGLYLIGIGLGRLLVQPCVKAFSLDPHKMYAPPGSGLLVVLDEKLVEAVRFTAPYMPLGFQETLLWTRSAAGLAAAYAGLKILGRDGLRKLSEKLIRLAERLKKGLEEVGVPSYSKPWTPLVAFNTGRAAGHVSRQLRSKGIHLYPSRIPYTLRYIAKWCHSDKVVDTIVDTVGKYYDKP